MCNLVLRGVSMKRVGLTLCVLACCEVVAACDRMYRPTICNGFNEEVYVSAIWHNGNAFVTEPVSAGQCTPLEGPMHKVNASELKDFDGYQGILRVFAGSEHILGIYRVPPNRLLSGLGHRPHYLLNHEGLFHIPHDREENWKRNTRSIQENSSVSLPNSF